MFERAKTVEAVWSLWNLVWEQLVKWGVTAVVVAMMAAIGASLYGAGEWINNNYGIAGWVVAGAVSIIALVILTALIVGLMAWATERRAIVQARRAASAAGSATLPNSAPDVPRAEIQIAPVLKALQVAIGLEDKFAKVTQEVASLADKQRVHFDAASKRVTRLSLAVSSRRRLEKAEEVFTRIQKHYEQLDPRTGSPEWETWSTTFNSLQMQMNFYYEQFLSNDPSARDLFLLTPGQLSPAYWKDFDFSSFPNEEAKHQFKTARIWHEKFRIYHGQLRMRCEKSMDEEDA